MHRALGYLSQRATLIRPGEGRKVWLTSLYFFLIITAYYLIKPASRSLVLGGLGSRMVPYVDLVCAVLMGPVVTLFARCVDRMPKARLVSISFWVVIGLLVLFWKLLAWPLPWIAGAFYVWVSIFSVLVVTLFWLVANDLYRPREAKRLFGFVGSGGILGGIAGSSIAAVGARLIGTARLPLLAAGVLAVCWVVVQRLWRFAQPDNEVAKPPRDTFLSNPRGFFTLILRSRYLLLLIAMVGLNKLITTLIYYQLNPFIEHAFPYQDARTAFTSVFLGGMNVLSFVVQFFFTGWILRRWGLPVALLALPAGLVVGTTGLLCLPVFWLAATTELYDGSMNYSLQQTTKELLYLPIDRSIRYKVKPFIDMVVFRFGKGAAAVLGIVLLDILHAPPRALCVVILPLLACWLVVAGWLHREYVMTIRTMLQARAAARRRAPPQAVDLSGAAEDAVARVRIDPFGSLANGSLSETKLALMDQLLGAPGAVSPEATALIGALRTYEHRLPNASVAQDEIQRLKTVIDANEESMARRRQAIEGVSRSSEQAAVDYLLGVVMSEDDAMLRQEAVRGLVKLRVHSRRLEFPAEPIRRQLAQEVANYGRIVHVAAVCRQHQRVPVASGDPLIALLRALAEESLAHIFRLLLLLYRPDDIQLVYDQLRAADPHVRADAIELLDNLVDATVRRMLVPMLDEDRFLGAFEEGSGAFAGELADGYDVLEAAIRDHNCWLSVTTLFAVGRMRLLPMRQELERASRHTAPVISAAAKVALCLLVSAV